MFMPDPNEQPPIAANPGIPVFYVGGDPSIEPIEQALSPLHTFHELGFHASVVGQLKNPYSLRCIAEHFARIIRGTRPRGPYMLAGWCAHGVVVLETAQMLREQRQDVALVILLDAINPERLRRQTRLGHVMATLQTKLNLLEREHKHLRSREQPAKDHVRGKLPPELTSRDCGLKKQTRNRNSRETQLGRSAPLEVLYTAVANYLPRPYDSPVLLIRSRRGVLGLASDSRLGWGKTLCKELEVCETEGNHYTMYAGPNVEGLVRKVSERLSTAEQGRQQHGREFRQIA
jgi:thioesterase domain-containing protein